MRTAGIDGIDGITIIHRCASRQAFRACRDEVGANGVEKVVMARKNKYGLTLSPQGETIKAFFSRGIWASNKTTILGSKARIHEPGGLYNTAKSATRALDILEFLAQAGRPLRAIEIAGPLELSPSSANQILKTLMDSAYLIFNPYSKRYFPSPRAAKIGALLAPSYFGPDVLDRLLQSVQAETGELVLLATAQGSSMQIIDVREPSRRPRRALNDSREPRHVPIGLRVPLFGSCTGGAWLSYQDEATVHAAIRSSRRELGQTAMDTVPVLDNIRRIREQGYVFGGMSPDDRVWAIAMPLPPCDNGIVLVIAVSGPAEEMEKRHQEIVKILRAKISLYTGRATKPRIDTMSNGQRRVPQSVPPKKGK